MKKAVVFCIASLLAAGAVQAQKPSAAGTENAAQTVVSEEEAAVVLISGKDLSRLSAAPKFQSKGIEKYRRWVHAGVNYPPEMESAQISGVVLVEIIVEPDGSVTLGRVLKSPAKGLTDAVVEVIEHSPKWMPGRMVDEANGREIPVRVAYTVPVEFKLRPNTKDPYMYRWKSQDEVRPYGSTN